MPTRENGPHPPRTSSRHQWTLGPHFLYVSLFKYLLQTKTYERWGLQAQSKGLPFNYFRFVLLFGGEEPSSPRPQTLSTSVRPLRGTRGLGRQEECGPNHVELMCRTKEGNRTQTRPSRNPEDTRNDTNRSSQSHRHLNPTPVFLVLCSVPRRLRDRPGPNIPRRSQGVEKRRTG